MKLIVEMKINKGDLPIMLCWQTLDGRLQIKHYQYTDDWVGHFNHLRNLGRNPQIYLRTTEETIFKEEDRNVDN